MRPSPSRTIFSSRNVASAVLAATFTVAFLVFTLGRVVRNDFLDAGFYIDALDENRVYDRFYEEVLSDPEIADIASEFFGDVDVERSYAVSTFRLILPPDTLRQATEQVVGDLIAYLRGETPRFETGVELAEAVNRQSPALTDYFTRRLIMAPEDVSLGETLEQAVAAFSADLAAGRIPEAVPVDTVPPDKIEAVAEAILGPINREVSDAVREQVLAALTVDDLRSAYAAAAPALLGTKLDDAYQRFLDFTGGGDRIDPVALLADASETSEDELLVRLNRLRDGLSVLFSLWLAAGMIVVMIGSIALLIAVRRSSVPSAMWTLGVMLSGVGVGVIVILWLVGPETIGAAFGSPVAEATGPGPEGLGLPESVATILRDVAASLLQELSNTVRMAALFLVFPGVAALLVSRSLRRRAASYVHQSLWRWTVQSAAIIALPVAAVIVFDFVTPERTAVADVRSCNGHVELCDRPYDEVVYPTTHNSMSAASLGWIFPFQELDIPAQLDDGMRAFLIDTLYWADAQDAADALIALADLDDETRRTLADLVGNFGDGPEGVWLCHSTCWLGATNFVETLNSLRVFLEDNPREVVTLIIQDQVSAADTADAFERAGLLPFLHSQPGGAPWPTLGEMIESGRRLVVLTESSGPPPDWYQPAFDLMQETSFRVARMQDFSCALNRGPASATLFQMNNWIHRASPDRVDAARVNEFGFMLNRARQCAAERGQIPNFIPVNFYRMGDVLDVVDELNGVS